MSNDMTSNNSSLYINNQYTSLLTLIDSVYPPLLCSLCDTTFNSRAASNTHFNEQHKRKPRYLCIHPHCDHKFVSRGALRFHISRSHLINNSTKPLPTPTASTTTSSLSSFITTTTTAAVTATTTTTSTKAIDKTYISKPVNNNIITDVHATNAIKSTKAFTSIPTITTTTTATTKTATKANTLANIMNSNNKNNHNNNHNDNNHYNNNSLNNKNKKTPSPSPSLSPISTPSPPASPFSLYKKHSKKPTLSPKAEAFLNSIYPPLECPSCHYLFNRKTNVIKHLTEVHLGQEPYRCIYPKCAHPRLYATREGLVYHIMRVHDGGDE